MPSGKRPHKHGASLFARAPPPPPSHNAPAPSSLKGIAAILHDESPHGLYAILQRALGCSEWQGEGSAGLSLPRAVRAVTIVKLLEPNERDKIILPSYEMCKLLHEHGGAWPKEPTDLDKDTSLLRSRVFLTEERRRETLDKCWRLIFQLSRECDSSERMEWSVLMQPNVQKAEDWCGAGDWKEIKDAADEAKDGNAMRLRLESNASLSADLVKRAARVWLFLHPIKRCTTIACDLLFHNVPDAVKSTIKARSSLDLVERLCSKADSALSLHNTVDRGTLEHARLRLLCYKLISWRRDPSTLCEYLLHPPETRKLVEFASPVLGAIQRLAEDYPTEIISTLGPPRLTLLFDALANDFDLAAFGLKSGTRSNPYLTRSRPLLKEIFSNVFVNCHRNAGLMRDEYISLQDLLANLSSLPATVSSTASSGPTMVASHSSGGISRSQAVVRCAADADVKQGLLEVCVATLNTDGQKLEVFEIAVESERILRESSLSERASNDLLSDPYSVDIQLQHRLLKSDRFLAFTGHKLLQGHSAMTLKFELDTDVLEYSIASSQLDDPVKLSLPRSQTYSSRSADGLSATIVLGLRFKLPDNSKSTFRSRVRDFIKLIKNKNKSSKANAAALSVDAVSMLAAISAYTLLRTSGRATQTQNDVVESLLQNPIFTEMMPASLRHLVDQEQNRLKLSDEFWSSRLKRSRDMPVDETNLLMMVLSEDKMDSSRRLLVLDEKDFTRLLHVCQAESWDTWRPVIVRLTLARSNLAAMTARLRELEQSCCFTVAFLSLGEPISASAMARFVHPFLGDAGSLRIVLQHSPALINNLRSTDLAAHIFAPTLHSSRTTAMVSSPAVDFAKDSPLALLFRMTDSLLDQMTEMSLRDWKAIEERNRNLDSWRESLLQWLLSVPNDGGAAFQQQHSTPETNATTTMEVGQPNLSAKVAVVVQRDAVVTDRLIRGVEEAARHTKSLPVALGHPVLLDCGDVDFFERLATLQLSTRRERRKKMVWAVLRRSHLLGAEERLTAVRTLVREGIKTIVVLSSLIPLSELDRFDTNSNCIFNFSHYVPPSLRTEDIGGENDDLDSSTLQEPATPASARLDEASGAPDCSRVLWICWTLLGRHVTLPLSDMLTKSQPGTVFNKMDFTDVGVPEHLLDGVLVICQAVFDSAFSEQPRAQGAGRATQVTIWLKSLVDLLVQNWGVGCDTPARLLSFDQFYATASCAQVLHHHNCLRLWAYTFLHVAIASDQREGERISAVLKGLDSLLPTLPNISGLSLLETLCLPSSASSSLDANIKYAARGSIADFEEGGVCTAVLQIATRGEELPWNELGVPFRQSPPSLTAFLDALAMCSHPLRFIMQLDARVLDSVLQGAEERTLQQLTRCLMPIAMEKSSSPLPSALPHLHLIDDLFHVCDWSLERIPAAFSALSIAYFHATKATNFFEQLCDARITLSNKHTAVVLRAGVHFRVGDSPTQWPPLLRVLIQLDSPPLLLIQQAEVAARLIVGSREELEEKVLKNAPKYGLCLLQAILHSSVRNTNSILRQTLLARFVYQLLDMTDEEKPVSVEDISSFDGEFSPAFVALLLSLLSSHCAADLLATTVIERAKRAYGNDSASVSTYIADCVMTNGELVQPQLSVLYFLRSCGSLDFPDAKHEALRVLWSVAFLQTDNLEKLVGAWSHLSPSDEARSPSTTNGLPLEADGMTSLHDAVLQHWCNSVSPVPLADGVIKVGKRDVARLSHSAQVALLRYMTQRLVNGSEPIVNFQAMHAIVALLWVHNPEQELPLRPDAIDGSPCRLDNATFVLINRLKVEFPMRTRALGPLGCSTLGKWFVLPHLLPLPLLITFNQAFHKYTPMPETKTFLLGQKHDDRVFYISVHEQKSDGRMMWQRVAESLKLEKVCELDTLLTFAPCQWNIVVDNGFDEDLMRTNFRVLLAAHHRRQAERCASYPNFSPKTRGVEVTNANVRYMYNLVCAWFAALKVSLSVLCKTIKETLGDEYLEQPLWSSSTLDSFLAQPCYTPVPSALDVHERSSLSLVRYFGPSQHDRALTLQALCSFLPADKAPGITIAATERHNYDQLWHRAVLALVESLNETLAEERVSVFAHLIKAMYQEAGEARKVAEPMLKDMVQRTKEWHNTNTNTNTNTLPRVFRWLIRAIGFSNGSGGLDRGVAVADQPDETGLIMLKLALKEWSVREPHDCCDITLREARSFLLKTHLSEGAKSDATGIAQVLDSLGEAVQRVDSRKPDRVTDLDFADKTTRHKCEQLLMGSVADGAPSCDSSELGRVESGGMSRTVDACGRHGSVPSLLHPLSVDDGQSKAASGAAVDVAQRASSRLSMMDLQEGIISFSFGDKNERNFVVQARSLVRRRSVSSDKWNTEISLCADVIEVIDGPGGALVKDVADGYDVFETCSTYQLLSKAELLNTNFFLPSQGRRHDNAVRQKVPLVTFPSNLLAWRFLVNNLPENAIVVGDGIVLKKSQTTKQLCPIAVNLEADSDCIADAFVLGPMLNYFGLVSEYYDFLSVLVAMALYSGQGPISAPEAPCSSLSEEDQLYKWVGDQLWKHANACQDDKVTVASMLRGKLGELLDHVEQSRRLISPVASGEAAPELDAKESDSSEASDADEHVAGQEKAAEELSNGPSSNSDFLEESTLCQWLPSHLVNETVRDVLRNGLAVSQSTSSHDKLLEMILLGDIPERFKAKNMLGVSSADEAKNFGLLSEESRVQGWGDGQIRSDVKLFSCLRVERDERFIPPGLANMVCEVRTHHAGEMVFVRCGANQRQDGAAQHAFGYILRNDTLNGRLANMSADLHAWICACITAPVANETIRWMLRLVLSHEYQLPELLNASEQLRHAIVAFSLADTYPNRDEEQSHVLREYTRLPHGVDEFVRHTSSVYGLFVCSVATRYLLSERLFPVDFVNVALLRKQGLTSDDQLYRHIVRTFSSATLIVYVHGVRRISDALLKWCAEYTKAVPFHYIYFEELDTDRNFSEIRDRCNFDHFVRPTLVELEYAMAHPADHDDDATSAPPSIENVNYVDPDSTTPDSNDDQSGWLMLGSSTHYRGDWKKQLKELLRCTEANVGGGLQQSLVKLRAMIVISPPGAGKTSYMEKVVSRLWAKDAKEYGGQFQYFDASNSVLVEEALVSLLARQCGREGRLWLVVDEYHMLTERQKFQLFQFLSVRSQEHNVRTIFYGNRMEKHDVDLVKAWQCGSARVDIFRCRLPAMHIRGLVLQEQPKALPDDPMRRTAVIEQLHWWCGVIRALFSDDVLTFRNRETLIEVLAAGPVVSELAKVLHDKAPQLGVLTTERVAFHMLQFFRRFGQTLALNPQNRSTEFARTVCVLANERDTDPMSLLVRTALVSATAASLSYPPISVKMLMSEGFINVNLDNSDVEDDPEPNGYTFMSFPEYTSQAPYSARFHPTFRLQSWVRYVFSNAHQRVSEKDAMLKIVLPDVAVLQRLVVIDQPDFPLVTAIGVQRQPLACGRAFAEHGDYTDLKWIQSNLQRSAAISWHKASVEWSRCFISSVPDLLNLLEVCPDQQACLNAVAPVNLCSLMAMTIGEKHGNDLAERVVELASRKFVEQEIGPSNPLLHATWLLYVRCDKRVLQRVGDNAQLRRGMLLWASRYGTEMLQVPMTEESELVQMNKRLSEDVYCAMCQLVGEDREGSGQARSNVVALFTGVFAELAPDPRFASAHALGNVEKQKLTHKAALWLAESQYPAHRKWPSGLEQLTRVMHGCEGVTSELLQEMCLWHAFRVDNRDGDPDVGSATLIGLLKDEEFAQALERGRVCLPEDELMQGVLARGMLREDSHLVVPKPWQLAFLTQLHKPWLAPIKVKQLLESPDFLKRTFFDGLCTLRKSNEIWPGAAWHDIEARKVLQDHFRHLHGCDDRSTRRDATTLMMERAKAELEERRRASLKVVSRLLRVEHPGILAYYNQTLGAAALREELKKKTVVQDEYKNPRGAHFDLAREKAFDGFHVLLGDFSVEYGFLMMKCRSDKEANFILENLRKKGDMMRDFDYVRDGLQIGLSPQHHRRQECRTLFPSDTLWDPVVYRRHLKTKNLKENIESRLGLKGFQLHIVCDEMEFVNKLKSGKFQVAWVISGPEVDVVRRCENQARRVEVLAETLASACLSFNRQRGGLFVFGENDPHFWHANVVLRALTGGKMHLAGNIPGGSFVAAEGVTAPDGTMQSCGQFSVTPDHVLMTGIQVLYEGETVAVPQNIPRNWKTVVTGGFPANKGPKEAKSLVVVNEGNFGDHRGRVVVDVGFTKLWLEWEKGGTDRYVANATAWLTGVDMHFVGLKADAPGPSSESLRKLALAPSLSSIPLPQLLNKVTLTPPSDVCVILDLSGSMWSYKDQAVRFAQQLCQDTLKRNPDNRMALIPFGCESEVFANFQCGSTTFDEGANRIRNLRHSFGSTAYSKPLKMAISSLHWRPKEAARRLVIFQTDGYPNSGDCSRFPHVARELVNEAHATVVGVVVTENSEMAKSMVSLVVGYAGDYDNRNGFYKEDLVIHVSDYNALVQKIGGIAQQAMSTM